MLQLFELISSSINFQHDLISGSTLRIILNAEKTPEQNLLLLSLLMGLPLLDQNFNCANIKSYSFFFPGWIAGN
jgi:hypothetical protein